MLRARSADGPMTVATEALLLAVFGSNWLPTAVEVATIVPSALGITLMVAEAWLL